MPNKPDPDKTFLGVRIPRPLYVRLRKIAAQKKMTMTEYVLELLGRETRHITLTSEDYEKIAKETRRAEEKLRSSKN